MNGKQLKNSILQWAIQGKLVPQDPNDEPASVLLERIRAEKARLVKEKKIKKDKNESIIYRSEDNSYYEKFLATGEVKCIDEEIPFEIPKGWEWARFGNIVNHSPQVICEDNFEVAFMPMALIDAGYRSSYTFEKRYWRNVKSGFTKMQKGDIAYAKITPCFQNRKSFILGDVPSNIATATTELNVIRIYADTFARWYLLYILKSDFFIKEAKYKGTAGQQRVLSDYVKSKLLPIPPRKEQDRICDKLQEVLPIVDNYDKFQSELNSLNSTIGERLKKTILQEAIQGKLVPQISEEGTARELLEQIRQEKQKLVKEGKLRKSVLSDSVIYKGDDNKYYERINAQTVEIELPFEYPNNWSVLRLKDICQLIDGEKRNGKGICLDAKYLRGKSSATIVEKGKFVYARDNIILVDGENSGEVFTVPQDGYMGSTFKQLWLSSAMWKPYILAFILFYKEDLRNSKRGAAIPHLNKELFYNLPIGIPPYQEQQRIAERINELSQLLK
ncbi:restriction endonuclease subunit S [Bacteroides acidifaciens]|uniref:restriction endonuclease subunit S n=1 Tax=Bacteroides acidifaciens TaxID=85831 RepID=UPI00258E7490|nr:restriction endonuclease subunit S [Bacteroides acidifaciens]